MVLGEMNYLVTGVSTTASKSSYDSYNSTMSGAAGPGLSSVSSSSKMSVSSLSNKWVPGIRPGVDVAVSTTHDKCRSLSLIS